MLRSRRLLAEPLWKQFFTGERNVEMDYMRCFKDQSDPSRLLLTLKEAASSEFKDFGDTPLLKALTFLNLLNHHVKIFSRDSWIMQQFWEHAKTRIESGHIVWSPRNLSLMSEFLVKHSSFALDNLKQSTLAEVFTQALSQNLRLAYLAQAVLGATAMPSFYPQLYASLIAKFNATTEFTYFTSEDLRVLTRALFLRPQVQQLIMTSVSVSSTLFNPTTLQTLQNTILERLQSGKLDVIHVVDIMEAFHNLADKRSVEFDERMMSWVLTLLDPAKEMRIKNVELKPSQIIELAAHINPSSAQAKTIFRLAANRFFLWYVLARGPHNMTLRPAEKLPIMINYIRVAAKHKLFQVVFLDQAVNAIMEMIDSSSYPWTISSISEALKGLAELNYAGRFNPAMVSKEHHWLAWQNLLSRCETIILKKVTVAPAELDDKEDEEEEESFDVSEVLAEDSVGENRNSMIDILWAFAVFDHYSKAFLAEIAGQLTPAGTYTEEQYAKLTQVLYWLKLEYMGEFKLDPLLEAEILDYKGKWDRRPSIVLPRSELKESIFRTLTAHQLPFQENFRDFPYILDFASEKEAVVVEDDSSYLEGSEGLIRTGRKRIELRQLSRLNWVLKRVSLKTWLKIGASPLFSKKA